MESRVDRAVELYKNGATCSQAVFVTYADLFGIERETAMKLGSPFGGGLAGQRQVCGAVSGMSMIAGLHNGMTVVGDPAAKKANFETVKMLSGEFKSEFGAIRCAELLGLVPGLPEGMEKKPCTEKVRHAAALVEKYLLPKEVENRM